MLIKPPIDGVIVERDVAIMDLHPVQLDCALFDILGASGGDNGAEGHGHECKAVDEEKEGVALHVVVEG